MQHVVSPITDWDSLYTYFFHIGCHFKTSLAGTYMLFELAKNPHVQEKLREEVLSVVGEHGVPTVQDLQKLPYAKNIITETLR